MLNVLVVSDESDKIFSLLKPSDAAESVINLQTSLDLHRELYDIAFLDLDIEGWNEKLHSLSASMPVIAFSRPDIKKVVEALKSGASEFIEKPLTPDSVGAIIAAYKKKILEHKYGFDEIIGASKPMQDVFNLIRRAAVSESSVLITGESGTGKELVSRAIHRYSPRFDNPFVTINCTAIPDTLLESELFGFEKGAFTGANYTKKGLLETAHGGTVFFDEIGDVSPMFQTKILRVIQEGEFMKIGAMKHIHVDLRFISATNKDLSAACQKGIFRLDLFYRLNVINIHLPPLRERKEDIELLANHFVKKHAPKRKDMLIKGISSAALKNLSAYSFPGNVRELENIIERAISLSNTSEIIPPDLPINISSTSQHTSFKSYPKFNEAVEAYEKELIVSAIKEAKGNISKAASILGIYRQHLQRKIKNLQIAS